MNVPVKVTGVPTAYVDPLGGAVMVTTGMTLLTVTAWLPVPEPPSSSVIVMLTVVPLEVPGPTSSRNLHLKEPSPLIGLNTRLPATKVPVPQLGVPAVNVSDVPGSVVSNE